MGLNWLNIINLSKICKNYKQMLYSDNNVVFYCTEHYIPIYNIIYYIYKNIELLDDCVVSKFDR